MSEHPASRKKNTVPKLSDTSTAMKNLKHTRKPKLKKSEYEDSSESSSDEENEVGEDPTCGDQLPVVESKMTTC